MSSDFRHDVLGRTVLGNAGKIKRDLRFAENNLIVTNIDIQSIEPVDSHMNDMLLKSVQVR